MATNYVSQASNSQIADSLRKLSRTQFSKNRIIGPRNYYLKDTIAKTDNFSASTLKVSHISQYVSASVLLHCFDGWNFLSRSVDALLVGDIATSIHLAYYSELRAAMSILASEGIGIFNKKHIYFDRSNAQTIFSNNTGGRRLTTHFAAKELMDEWKSLPSKKDVIFKCIKVNNRSLTDWVNAGGHSVGNGYAGSLLETWLSTWSIDLTLDIDQQLRNETSYRPHFEIPQVVMSEKVEEIIEIWSGLEPTGSNSFLDLDMHLLRLTIEQLFKISTGRTVRHSSYSAFVNSIFDNLGESRSQELYEFIFRRIHPLDHILIRQANQHSSPTQRNFDNSLPMICRAILLLRFSTGIIDILFTEASIDRSSLEFWWRECAVKYGIITADEMDVIPSELYADVSSAISSIRSNGLQLNSVRQANMDIVSDLYNLKQFQRICFWGLGL